MVESAYSGAIDIVNGLNVTYRIQEHDQEIHFFDKGSNEINFLGKLGDGKHNLTEKDFQNGALANAVIVVTRGHLDVDALPKNVSVLAGGNIVIDTLTPSAATIDSGGSVSVKHFNLVNSADAAPVKAKIASEKGVYTTTHNPAVEDMKGVVTVAEGAWGTHIAAVTRENTLMDALASFRQCESQAGGNSQSLAQCLSIEASAAAKTPSATSKSRMPARHGAGGLCH